MRFKDIPMYTQKGSWECVYSPMEFVEFFEHHVKDHGLVMIPDFQRGHIWTEEQQIAWVEFIFRGGNTSRVVYINDAWEYVSEDKNPCVVVDGLQRITAMTRFVHNEIKAFGHFYKDFTDRPPMETWLRINKNNLRTRKEVLSWYLEMNSGGTPHTEEELSRVKKLLEEESEKGN